MIVKRTVGGRVFDICNVVLLLLLVVVTAYPVLYVIIASVSNPILVYKDSPLLLWPRGFSLQTYKIVFDYPALWMSYGNTLFYVTAGTVISLFLTILGAYGHEACGWKRGLADR